MDADNKKYKIEGQTAACIRGRDICCLTMALSALNLLMDEAFDRPGAKDDLLRLKSIWRSEMITKFTVTQLRKDIKKWQDFFEEMQKRVDADEKAAGSADFLN